MDIRGRVLAVDDNLMNLTIIETLLEDDHDLRTARSGEEALEIAAVFRPDLVLLDIMMPGIDGYETCRRLRSDPALRHTKIIMVSAKALLVERLKGYHVGADDYVTKPFDHDELLAKVRVYLRLKSAEEVEEVKGRVVEVLQHSTRAPLTAIICNVELLMECDELVQDRRREVYELILRSAHRLQKLLEKGETLAAMKARRFAFEFARGDVCEVVRETLADLNTELSRNGLLVQLDAPESAEGEFDRQQMKFVVRALLENAMRFSSPGGRIRVTLESSDGQITLGVSDEGQGIPTELLPQVFEEFADPVSPLHNKGDGMSLAIVREIVSAHGGSICATNELNSGATFRLRFPVSAEESIGALTGCGA